MTYIMTQNFLIFLPNLNCKWKNSLLYGLVFRCDSGLAVYVLGEHSSFKCEYLTRYKIIGQITSNDLPLPEENLKDCWISIKYCNIKSKIEKITVNTASSLKNMTIIVYNKDHIIKSQLLNSNYNITYLDEVDFIFRLIREIKLEAATKNIKKHPARDRIMSSRIFTKINPFVQIFAMHLEKFRIIDILKMFSFGNHFVNVMETVLKVFEIKSENYQTVQYFNYVIARILDAILGKIVIYYMMNFTTSDDLFSALVQFQEYVVMYLKNTVEWLMGSPAGFKLYCPLNNVLGHFYQFHISLWWTFLKLANPLLEAIFNFLLFLGNFGFSFQVAMLADLLAIITVHIYCIYVYVASLYYFQMKGLRILSRLFIGKKRNPVPGSVHSSPYTTEQLLFGTVSFTILLFLLPTTLIYYSVFTAIRIILIFIGGILTRLKYFVNIFPVYVVSLWLYNPVLLTCTVRLDMKTDYFLDDTSVTQLKPVCKSLWETIKMCIPETVQKPDNIEWRKLTTDVLTGNLIYPV